MPLQEIIDWLGQKDEELSAQLPLRGDVVLVQQEKEMHAVGSLTPPLLLFTAKASCSWAALPGTPTEGPNAHSLWIYQSLPVSISAPHREAEPHSQSKSPWYATGRARLGSDSKSTLHPQAACRCCT